MKYDESKVNNAKVGDLVYAYNSLSELKSAIERERECDINKNIVLRAFNEFREEPYEVYDMETEDTMFFEFVYTVSDIVETKTERFLRVLKMSREWFYFQFRKEVCDVFFKFKKRGLITNPTTDYEEKALDWSYDLEDVDDCERFMQELKGKSLREVQLAFISIGSEDRYVFHNENMQLILISIDDDIYLAICNLLTRALDGLV